MHLLKDENGYVIPHGEHDHEHHHEHHHDHPHEACKEEQCGTCPDSGNCKNGDIRKETLALLTYMLQHNEHHAAELDQMADNLEKMGLMDAARTIREGVSDFQKGNLRLSLALTLVKEEFKADGKE